MGKHVVKNMHHTNVYSESVSVKQSADKSTYQYTIVQLFHQEKIKGLDGVTVSFIFYVQIPYAGQDAIIQRSTHGHTPIDGYELATVPVLDQSDAEIQCYMQFAWPATVILHNRILLQFPNGCRGAEDENDDRPSMDFTQDEIETLIDWTAYYMQSSVNDVGTDIKMSSVGDADACTDGHGACHTDLSAVEEIDNLFAINPTWALPLDEDYLLSCNWDDFGDELTFRSCK
jgi:hypothetical protein